MENEIKNIIREFANAREETLDNAVKRICALFDVVGQSEQLVCDIFQMDSSTSSATKCKCGREKWEHTN